MQLRGLVITATLCFW